MPLRMPVQMPVQRGETVARCPRGRNLIQKAGVWIGKRDWPDGKERGGGTTLGAVTFPDSGCANFSWNPPDDATPLDLIARSFHPTVRTSPRALCR